MSDAISVVEKEKNDIIGARITRLVATSSSYRKRKCQDGAKLVSIMIVQPKKEQCTWETYVFYRNDYDYTSNTALTHPSSSGLFVTWAIFPHATLPVVVTKPSSETFTSTMVPFVRTPRLV